MNTKKRVGIVLLAICASFWALYAANTLIVNIAWGQIWALPGSSNTRVMTLGDGDLKYMNEGNDSNSTGDYFVGYYYDPAYWFFQTNAWTNNVRVSGTPASWCGLEYDGRKLIWYSYNPDFGFINFAHDANNFVYICIPLDENDDTLSSSLHGYAYSPYIGFQNFDDIFLDTSVDIIGSHNADWRFLRVDGIVSSENPTEAIAGQLTSDVRVLGKITKSTLRKNVQKKVYDTIRNVSPSNGARSVSWLWATSWPSWDGITLKNGSVLYFGNLWGNDVIVDWNDAITGNKTLVVEWGNIYITENIRWDGILWLIAIRKWNNGGNIYIHPRVTDIHAIMYADRSVLSVEDIDNDDVYERIADGSTQAQELASQLYIYGSIFSENTIGWSVPSTKLCPYFAASCNANESKKYDLNLLRRYILVQEVDVDWNPILDGSGNPIKNPQYSGAPTGKQAQESFMGDGDNSNTEAQKPGYRVFPLIIDYNPNIQQTPPPFFD